MTISITLVIIAITCLISFSALSNQKLENDLIFYPPAISENKQWYRFFSCGLVHADVLHLAFNMIGLYYFGTVVENGYDYADVGNDNGFKQIFGVVQGKIFYVLLYVLALGFCLLPTYAAHKHDRGYRSLGASGAVSAVLFASLLLEPRSRIHMFFIPIGIPGYIFAPLFLIVSHFLARRGRDNINHSAHIWGAIFGLIFVILTTYFLSDYQPITEFLRKVRMDFIKYR